MKKTYFLLLAFFFFAFSFAQTTIVTIDRANGPGPTDTGNDPTISSIGLTRGSGVNQRNGTDFSSNNWAETSQANAETNNDYLQWSTSSSSSNDIEIQRIDIRLRRNMNGPTNWQLHYSIDDFATAGIAVNASQSIVANSNVITNIIGLSINSGSAATITFRLYAWGAATNGGLLRVKSQASWSDFGIALPGLRLSGNITSTTTNSTESNIVATSFDPTDNIDYTSYSATSGLTTSNAIKIGEFTIQDGGNDLTDADILGTTLTDLEFNITNSSNIAALAVFDGSTNISEVTTVTDNTSFTGITGISAIDEGSKTFDVYATFNSTATDNEQLQLTISSASADGTAGSIFEAFDAGGAQTPIAGDDNRIEVIASQLIFTTEPLNGNQFEVIHPTPVVIATDINDNLDLDFINSISLTTTGTFDVSATTSLNAVAGESTFSNLVFSAKGTGLTITATSSGLTDATSSNFDINGPLITIAIQDFDNTSPEWTYTNDIPFFDNGWGTDGYYGIININDASPMNNPQFSGNILGDNDLNDEGNGTNTWATITFSTIDVSSYENVKLKFDWDIQGYVYNSNDAQYRLIYDGSNESRVFLFDGNGAIDSDEGSISLDIPASVNTVALQIRIRNNRLTGFSGFDNFRIVSEFDGLVYASSTWVPNAPSDTTGTDNVYVLDGTYTVGSNIETNNFYIADLATTSVTAGESIVVNSNLVNKGTLELNSTSTTYSSLIVENTSEGDVIYKRHVNINTGGNDLISAPVTGQTFGDFATVNTNIFENPSDVSQKLFGPFNKTTGLYQLYDTDITADANATLDAGNGYRAASTNSSTFTFEGTVETTTITKPIVVSGPNSPEWNLIGNPYSSYITLSDFLTANTSEFEPTNSGIYGYDGDASNGWEIWNQAYSDANPGTVITPGQGFLVASKVGGGTITFNPSMRSIGSTDDFVLGRVSNPTLAHIKLQMSKTDTSYNTDIYFNNNATLSMDAGYDSALFGNYAPGFALYSHLVENNSGLKLAIQSVHYNALNDVIIPLGVNASQGEQLTFSIFETDIQRGIDIYLEDTVTNTFTLLNTSDYVFTPNTNLSGTGRFFLRFSGDALSTSEESFETVQIYTSKTPKTLFIKGELLNDTKAEIYDIQGRLILTSKLNSNSINNQIDISNITSGIYIVNLNNGIQQKSQKVIIK
ncbi:MAG: T9SS type A sorting domain-containing protein [Psychroserpens sp.]|uniref:T9SS type A sorting domain-containing protein n=1 Tax=Psychroserpens sp. TaxID=2020870 RepID=UPI0030028F1C